MLVIGHAQVVSTLDDLGPQVMDLVREGYLAHAAGRTVVPHSVFLRPRPDRPERIIALTADVMSSGREVLGLKWISSYPENVAMGLPRASGVIVLNSAETGVPTAVLEASAISATRTGAGAALAAAELSGRMGFSAAGVTIVGCGLIGWATLMHLRQVLPELRVVTLADSRPERADSFATALAAEAPELTVEVAGSALGRHRLVCFTTTAVEPHTALDAIPAGSLVLHVSLRDLHPEGLLDAVNVVDDTGHVLRAGTSLDLAARQLAARGGDTHALIAAEIGPLLAGTTTLPDLAGRTVVFSPFGLAMLDVLLADAVVVRAGERGPVREIPDFHPAEVSGTRTAADPAPAMRGGDR